MLNLDPSFKYMKRHRWSPITHILDIADYQRGFLLNLPGFKMLKIKTSKIMQKDKYLIVVSIFGFDIFR
jgi:hypothetical protein